jgi:hypothetical protein
MTTTTTMRIQKPYESTNCAKTSQSDRTSPISKPTDDTTTAILVYSSPDLLIFIIPSSKQQPGDETPALNLPSPPLPSFHFGFHVYWHSSFLVVHMIYPPLSPSSEPQYISPFTTKSKLDSTRNAYHAFIPFDEYEHLTNGK